MIIDERTASLEEKAYFILEEEILSGSLSKGDNLKESVLSERLGVSRTPIRSAIHRLAEDGLVSIVPNKGAVVRGIDAEDLINIYKIRIRLEGLASASAATNISKEAIERLRSGIELSEFYISKKDAEHVKELDTEFHLEIYKASGNPQLEKILSELHRKIKSYRKMSLSVSGRLENSLKEHKEILNAIEMRDAELADKLTSAHVESALYNVILALKK